MKNKWTLILALMLVVMFATSIFIFAGGVQGKSAYQLAVENGYKGTETEWLNSISGKSAYELAVEKGYTGSEAEWLKSLKGKDGQNADSIDFYQVYTDLKSTGELDASVTYLEFIHKYVSSENQMTANIQNSIKSAVSIFVFYNGTSRAGSGIIWSVDDTGTAYVVTNYHVTYTGNYSNQIYLGLFDDSYYTYQDSADDAIREHCILAEYVGGDKNFDLAVIKISNNQKIKDYYERGLLKAVELADSDEMVVGTSCYTVGNPLGEGMSAAQGIISTPYEQIYISDSENSYNNISIRDIRKTIDINGGNSGGGLYNADGKLIGVINACREYVNSVTRSTPVRGFGFAIPLASVQNVIPAIIRTCNGTTITKLDYKDYGFSTKIDSCYSRLVDDGNILTAEIVTVDSVDDNFASKVISGEALKEDDVLKSFKVQFASDNTITEEMTINHYYTLSDYLPLLSTGDKVTITFDRIIASAPTTYTITIQL